MHRYLRVILAECLAIDVERSTVQRVWDRIRSCVGGAGNATPAVAAPSRDGDTAPRTRRASTSVERTARAPRYRNAWVGIGVVGGVLGVLAVIAGWQTGAFDRGAHPLATLRQRLGIGSGATAATLIPAMAPDCAHITMLQRSPTYFRIGRNAIDIAEVDAARETIRECLYLRAPFPSRHLLLGNSCEVFGGVAGKHRTQIRV